MMAGSNRFGKERVIQRKSNQRKDACDSMYGLHLNILSPRNSYKIPFTLDLLGLVHPSALHYALI